MIIIRNPPQKEIDQLKTLLGKGRFSVVFEHAESVILHYPNSFIIWNILGAAFMDLGSTEEAAEAFKKVIYLNPNYADGFSNLGVILKKQDKLEDAAKKEFSYGGNEETKEEI